MQGRFGPSLRKIYRHVLLYAEELSAEHPQTALPACPTVQRDCVDRDHEAIVESNAPQGKLTMIPDIAERAAELEQLCRDHHVQRLDLFWFGNSRAVSI